VLLVYRDCVHVFVCLFTGIRTWLSSYQNSVERMSGKSRFDRCLSKSNLLIFGSLQSNRMFSWLMAFLCGFGCLAKFNPENRYCRETLAHQHFSAGFGRVSPPWLNFTVKARSIIEVGISGARGGLDATIEILETEGNRVRFLEGRIQDKKVGRLLSLALGCVLF